MTDHIITTTLTPAEQAAFESGRKAGLREAFEEARRYGSCWPSDLPPYEFAHDLLDLIKEQP